MPPLLDVQYLVQLACNFPVPSSTRGNGSADIPISGNGAGLTRRVAGSGSHWLTTDGVEHADSVSIKTSTARQLCNFFTGVPQLS